jgi:7-cyano-7-deazaguanine synthase
MRLLLLSGGIDSTALAAWQRPDLCLTIDYGQRPARGEIAAASSVAAALGLRHRVLRIDLSELGLGPLAGRPPSDLAAAPEWWPYRNQMLVTLAAMRFVAEGLSEIMLGAVATDVHADGRAPFLRAIDRAMRLQEGAVRVTAPALRLTAPELLRVAGVGRALLGATFSCHVMEYACGRCRGCEKHADTLACLDEGSTSNHSAARPVGVARTGAG